MNNEEMMGYIERLLDLGYTIEQIENILGVNLTVRTQKVQMIVEVFRTEGCGKFEINMN